MMRLNWTLFLLIALICFDTIACRKKSGGALRPPAQDSLPSGNDSLPVDSIPSSDTIAYTQTAVHSSIGDNIGGFYEAFPSGYDADQTRHPLIVFLHGGGELGNGESDLPLVLKHAIPKLITENKFPKSFSSGGSSYSFVIISPQFKSWPKKGDVESVVDYAIDHYRVDTHRIYMVGLSMGGGATWEYAARQGKRLAAMVPISGASWADSATAKAIAQTSVNTWAFHNMDDEAVTYKSTTRYVDFIQFYNPDFPVKLTLWSEGGHDAWTKATDPLYTEEGLDIYEWMLQYVR